MKPSSLRAAFRLYSPRLSAWPILWRAACMGGGERAKARRSGNIAIITAPTRRPRLTGGAQRAVIKSMCAIMSGRPPIRSISGATDQRAWRGAQPNPCQRNITVRALSLSRLLWTGRDRAMCYTQPRFENGQPCSRRADRTLGRSVPGKGRQSVAAPIGSATCHGDIIHGCLQL